MTKRVESATPEDSALSAVTRLAQNTISCIIVLQDEKPVGIFTERDVVKLLAEQPEKAHKLLLKEVMGQPVKCILEDVTISEASRLMESRRCRRFPVVDADGKLVGLVTQTDILGASTRVLERYSSGLEKMVEKRTRELQIKNYELEVLSVTDPLTGLSNRRYLYRRLEEELSRSRRQGTPFGCIMMDIDHFKSVNDQYGHDLGDSVLAGICTLIRQSVRGEDVVARYGGEEFVVLSQVDAESAFLIGERIRRRISMERFTAGDGEEFSVTISCGVVVSDESGCIHDADELMRLADNALYSAKANGRNRTELYHESIERVA